MVVDESQTSDVALGIKVEGPTTAVKLNLESTGSGKN